MFRAALVDQLCRLKAEYLTAHSEAKKRLRREIAAVRAEVAGHEQRDGVAAGFDWPVEFAEVFLPTDPTVRPGFDVVVANPPYVRMELFKPIKPQLRLSFPEAHSDRADLYVYFYARAHQLLADGGVASFISSNKWLRAGYGEPLRCHLLDAQRFRLVVDFGELPVFQTAATFPGIFLWQRAARGEAATWAATVRDLPACYDQGVAAHVAAVGEAVQARQFRPGTARLAPDAARRERMEASGPTLGELVGGRLLYGIKTGLNEAFIVDRATRDRLCAEDARSAEILKPLLRGDDVRRYEIHFREQYLVWTYIGVPIDDYPAVRRHLEQHQEAAKRRSDQGEHWWELRACAYYDVFDAPKIVYPVIGKETRFSVAPDGWYSNDKTFLLPGLDWYLLAVLNSAPSFAYLRDTCSVLGDAGSGGRLEFRAIHVQQLPIPTASESERLAVGGLAERAQGLHGRRRAAVESFLVGLGTSSSASSSKNRLEQPWALSVGEFASQARRQRLPADEALFAAVQATTAALTAEIAAVEQEIDERVAGLYGL